MSYVGQVNQSSQIVQCRTWDKSTRVAKLYRVVHNFCHIGFSNYFDNNPSFCLKTFHNGSTYNFNLVSKRLVKIFSPSRWTATEYVPPSRFCVSQVFSHKLGPCFHPGLFRFLTGILSCSADSEHYVRPHLIVQKIWMREYGGHSSGYLKSAKRSFELDWEIFNCLTRKEACMRIHSSSPSSSYLFGRKYDTMCEKFQLPAWLWHIGNKISIFRGYSETNSYPGWEVRLIYSTIMGWDGQLGDLRNVAKLGGERPFNKK